MTYSSLIFGFFIQLSTLMVYLIIQHRNKPVSDCKELCKQENGLNHFRTVVSEVHPLWVTLNKDPYSEIMCNLVLCISAAQNLKYIICKNLLYLTQI